MWCAGPSRATHEIAKSGTPADPLNRHDTADLWCPAHQPNGRSANAAPSWGLVRL
jgi:hypothetical protein